MTSNESVSQIACPTPMTADVLGQTLWEPFSKVISIKKKRRKLPFLLQRYSSFAEKERERDKEKMLTHTQTWSIEKSFLCVNKSATPLPTPTPFLLFFFFSTFLSFAGEETVYILKGILCKILRAVKLV